LFTVAGNADSADLNSVLVKRHSARRTVERRSEDRDNRQARRRTESDDAARRAELVDVGREKIRETDTDERAGRGVAHPGREMLLDDESSGARRERVLVTAQIRGGAGFRTAAGTNERGRWRAGQAPDREDAASQL